MLRLRSRPFYLDFFCLLFPFEAQILNHSHQTLYCLPSPAAPHPQLLSILFNRISDYLYILSFASIPFSPRVPVKGFKSIVSALNIIYYICEGKGDMTSTPATAVLSKILRSQIIGIGLSLKHIKIFVNKYSHHMITNLILLGKRQLKRMLFEVIPLL